MMANNLYNQLNQQLQNNLMQSNPQLQSIIKMIKESGMTPKELFFQKAREMGVDPNTILSQLK